VGKLPACGCQVPVAVRCLACSGQKQTQDARHAVLSVHFGAHRSRQSKCVYSVVWLWQPVCTSTHASICARTCMCMSRSVQYTPLHRSSAGLELLCTFLMTLPLENVSQNRECGCGWMCSCGYVCVRVQDAHPTCGKPWCSCEGVT